MSTNAYILMTARELLERYIPNAVEHERFETLLNSLEQLRPFIRGRTLDFGASYGLSMLALREIGVSTLSGVEVDAERVRIGRLILANAGLDPNSLIHVADTRKLPYPNAAFDTILANAVFEHIPQPRAPFIQEAWRVLAPGGHLLVNETPNKYLPFDYHTTGLALVPWLPSKLARRYAIWRGRYPRDGDWAHSGWRGLGYYELVGALPRGSYHVHRELSRRRHRILHAAGLPANLLDPYPVFVLQKKA